MVILKKNNVKVYSSNNINLENIKENTSFFSSENGNSNECKFIATYKDLINLGWKIKLNSYI